MSIKIGSKWVKDGEVVEVLDRLLVEYTSRDDLRDCTIVFYQDKGRYNHAIAQRDFLEQYKPYEPVYEYKYATDIHCGTKILDKYFTEDEIKEEYEVYQRIDFTKRERK